MTGKIKNEKEIKNFIILEFVFILACPSISRVEPSGDVQRLRGSVLEVFCYVNTTTPGSYNIRFAFNLDTPGK
jgi:hypothetical protein